MIEVHQLVKHFGTKEALRGVSFTARPGEVTGYLGPNGAGKSTTLKILTGLLRPTSGTVRVCGYDLAEAPLDVKRRIGYVPESAALYASLTPHEHLSLVAELYHLDRPLAAARIATLLRAFELTDAADRQISALSKGMRQKVLLCCALLHDPEVVLFDEPLNGLDVHGADTLRRLMAELVSRGKTLLFCSHLLEVVERLCPRVVVVHQGQIVADDNTAQLLAGSARGTLEGVLQELTRSGTQEVRNWSVLFGATPGVPPRPHE